MVEVIVGGFMLIMLGAGAIMAICVAAMFSMWIWDELKDRRPRKNF